MVDATGHLTTTMANISIDKKRLDLIIKKVITDKLQPIFQGPDMKKLLEQQAVSLRSMFASSEEFSAIKGRLVGQFGFTSDEVSNLDRILTLMVPGTDITMQTLESVGGVWWAMLQWVDYEKIKTHPFARHELTRKDPTTGAWEVTNVVSWIQWLEEGVAISDQAYMRTNSYNRDRSRSEVGVMRDQPGFTFVIPPSRIFERIGKLGGKTVEQDLLKGLGVLIRRK